MLAGGELKSVLLTGLGPLMVMANVYGQMGAEFLTGLLRFLIRLQVLNHNQKQFGVRLISTKFLEFVSLIKWIELGLIFIAVSR